MLSDTVVAVDTAIKHQLSIGSMNFLAATKLSGTCKKTCGTLCAFTPAEKLENFNQLRANLSHETTEQRKLLRPFIMAIMKRREDASPWPKLATRSISTLTVTFE